ncbi:MAG: cellulase family glycosylhydrolase [Chitinivibrionales bacterium]|nr:cellulase family glycosylhydrolase [Chitinivibrionales bacterium]MBD3396409.1 cellulase family glycosylhydrolase [Chitinivibrionales bacterium]
MLYGFRGSSCRTGGFSVCPFRVLSLCTLLALAAARFGPALAARGRVRLSETSIVSDWGTPLRGCYWSLDNNGGRLPSRGDVANIKNLGLNALHLWPECYRINTGQYTSQTDQIVQWCAEEGLYCVICYGGCDKNTEYFYNKVTAFWRHYAPRYKDETHVVYEIQNEPQWFSCEYADSAIDMNRDCYNIIRELAPETHVLFFTYCNIYGAAEPVIRDVGRLGDGIDWGNASVAFHGYLAQQGEPSPATQEQAIRDAAANGIRMTCTEFPPELAVPNVPVYEATGISYFHFKRVNDISGVLNSVVNAGTTWRPDFGSWPEQHAEQVRIVYRARQSFGMEARCTPRPRLMVTRHGLQWLASGAVLYDLQGKRRTPAGPTALGGGHAQVPVLIVPRQ